MNIVKRKELAPFAFGTLARFCYGLVEPCFVCGKTEDIILWECFTWDIKKNILQFSVVFDFYERYCRIVTVHDNIAMLYATHGLKFVEQVLIETKVIAIK